MVDAPEMKQSCTADGTLLDLKRAALRLELGTKAIGAAGADEPPGVAAASGL
jgi:hypothetical protein